MDGFNSFDDDEIELPEDSKDLEDNGEVESSRGQSCGRGSAV